jgi:hypothetical protein
VTDTGNYRGRFEKVEVKGSGGSQEEKKYQ